MKDTPKPPMVVWLDRFADQGNEMGVYATVKTPLINDDNVPSFGPYVHLDQFMAEVRKKAINIAEKDAEAMGRVLPAPIDEDCMTFWLEDALQELAKEINEGTA